MPRISTDNYDTVASWNGSQDLFVVEQPDGTKVATPAMVKQYILNDMDEVPTQNSNKLVKSGGVFSTVDDVYSVMGQNGVKNLIPYPYYESSYTQNGITWTVNADGTITADGTATANEQFHVNEQLLGVVKEGTSLIITGCPSGGGSGKYGLYVDKYVSSYSTVVSEYGEGGKFVMPSDASRVRILAVIASGATVSNLTFKPMLRLASDTDNTYQPYAKTNRQLTEEIGDLSQTGLTGDNVAGQLTTVKGQIASLQTNRAYHVDVGSVIGNNPNELLGAAWDKLTIYGVPVLVNYQNYGQHMALMFKYNAAGDYGMAMGMRYGTTSIIKMGVNSGVKSYATT